MAFPTEVSAVLRAIHITSAVVWLGFLYFMTFVRPRVMAGLSEETRRQVLPHLAKQIGPWMAVSATLTIVFGALVYWDLGDIRGYANMGWGLNLAVLLAFVMYVLGMAFVVPFSKKAAKVLEGGKPPSPAEIQRAGTIGMVNSVLSFVVLFLMVASGRIAAFT